MFEPILRPRAGQVFWGVAAIGGAALAAMDTLVVTRAGTFSVTIAGIVLGLIGGLRAIGITVALARGRGSMPWAFRVASWAVLLVPLAFLGALATPTAIAVAAGICALDAIGGMLAPKVVDRPGPVADRMLARLKVSLLLGLGLLGLLLFHFLWASRVEGGLLLDWAYLAVLFGITLRYTALPARRAAEEGSYAEAEARRHTPRARVVPDPGRASVSDAVAEFRRTGAVARLLAYVDGFGVPGLSDEARALLNRPGTRREDDLTEVADLLEKRLSAPASLTPKVRG